MLGFLLCFHTFTLYNVIFTGFTPMLVRPPCRPDVCFDVCRGRRGLHDGGTGHHAGCLAGSDGRRNAHLLTNRVSQFRFMAKLRGEEEGVEHVGGRDCRSEPSRGVAPRDAEGKHGGSRDKPRQVVFAVSLR